MTGRQLTIEMILAAQRGLQAAMGDPMGTDQRAVKENVLAAIVELTEVLAEINWKPWKSADIYIDREALLTEMCDVLQFWANMVNAMDFSHEDVALALSKKWSENYRRIKAKETSNG